LRGRSRGCSSDQRGRRRTVIFGVLHDDACDQVATLSRAGNAILNLGASSGSGCQRITTA
jgi:hypothetical protein